MSEEGNFLYDIIVLLRKALNQNEVTLRMLIVQVIDRIWERKRHLDATKEGE